jgi:hypothetical protein
MRFLTLILAAAALAACASDVQMQDPRSGETATCAQSLGGWDPWSQTYACAARHMEQGWVVTSGGK